MLNAARVRREERATVLENRFWWKEGAQCLLIVCSFVQSGIERRRISGRVSQVRPAQIQGPVTTSCMKRVKYCAKQMVTCRFFGSCERRRWCRVSGKTAWITDFSSTSRLRNWNLELIFLSLEAMIWGMLESGDVDTCTCVRGAIGSGFDSGSVQSHLCCRVAVMLNECVNLVHLEVDKVKGKYQRQTRKGSTVLLRLFSFLATSLPFNCTLTENIQGQTE